MISLYIISFIIICILWAFIGAQEVLTNHSNILNKIEEYNEMIENFNWSKEEKEKIDILHKEIQSVGIKFGPLGLTIEICKSVWLWWYIGRHSKDIC